MLAKERRDMIVALVNENGSVLVRDLSERFQVTEDSIRKDLTALSNEGLLKKTYGGAVSMRQRVNVHDYHVSQRRGKNIEEKQKIARKAVDLIENRDVIFLDISTVNIELVKLLILEDRPVTVVTNMIDIMMALAVDTKIKMIFLGGTFSDGKDGFVGAATNQQIKNFRFDKAFMGVVGVDLDLNNVMTYTSEDAMTKKEIMQASNKSYMMLETRKFAAEGNYIYAKVDEFTGAILEQEVDEKLKKQLENYTIELIV